MIKLIALDMDGTLLDSNKNLPADFCSWVIDHPEIQVVIASGRQYYALEDQFSEISDRLIFIAENGSVIVKNDEVLYKAPMAPETVVSTIDIVNSSPAYTGIVCGLKSAYLMSDDPFLMDEATKYYKARTEVESLYDAVDGDDIFKVAIFIHDFKAEEEYNKFPEVPEGLTAVLSGDSWIDVAKTGVDKGEALKVLIGMLDISPDESMVFGDYLNDVTMMQAVTHSWAMKNAHPDLKAVANFETEYTNDEDGVMKTLRKVIG